MTLPDDLPAELEQQLAPAQRDLLNRVRRGEWLQTGEVATLLGVHRATVDRMIRAGRIAARKKPGAALVRPRRECSPDHVLRLLVEHLYEPNGPTV